ncbi:MAG: hypothetical protein E3J52_04465 [Promethearchaeota archaeon]|nr:MAG: hypothetical protein E3J52_04465 [Candidatus Lokiarchaeota archaeon]
MERIILTHWSSSIGPEPIIQYPPEKPFPAKDLFLKIWAKHELNKENSVIEFTPEDEDNSYVSVIQRFEGEVYFLILVYSKEDMHDDIIKESPEILALISKNLIELINTNKITRTISEAYNTIRNYSKLDEEENLINFFQDRIKYTILQILRNGVISKQKLTNILRHEYGFSTVNIDLILISFFHENLLVKKNVPGSKECFFLIRDLSCIRIPPDNLPSGQMEENLLRKFKSALKKYYQEYYNASDFENKTIMQTVLFNKDVFSLLKTLRKKQITVNDCLNILNNKEELFNELIDKKFIYEAKGQVYLFSDVRFIKFSPYYILEKLVERYQNQEISLNEYITHLKLLTEKIEEPLSVDYEIV